MYNLTTVKLLNGKIDFFIGEDIQIIEADIDLEIEEQTIITNVTI